jgi:hypothetical protein
MKNTPTSRSFLNSASRWMRRAWSKQADEAALAACGEAATIARDLGPSVSELHALCATNGGSPKLLQQRMSQLHLNTGEIKRDHPGVLHDLEKTCARCPAEARCGRDFSRNPDPKGWMEYCPNGSTLQELQHEAAK